jgi:hypothetical protein
VQVGHLFQRFFPDRFRASVARLPEAPPPASPEGQSPWNHRDLICRPGIPKLSESAKVGSLRRGYLVVEEAARGKIGYGVGAVARNHATQTYPATCTRR